MTQHSSLISRLLHPQVLPSLLLSIAIVIAAIIFALMTRYEALEAHPQHKVYQLDRWTGDVTRCGKGECG